MHTETRESLYTEMREHEVQCLRQECARLRARVAELEANSTGNAIPA